MFALLALITLTGAAGCKEKVTYQRWCTEPFNAACAHCSPTDMQGCAAGGVQGCMAGHTADEKTGRTAEELQACVAAMAQAPCASLAAGNLPPACTGR